MYTDNRVLLVGYGKIGSIKCTMYSRLGFNVSILDHDPIKQAKAEAQGFSLYSRDQAKNYSVIDICTPSGTHIDVLNKVISKCNIKSTRIIIVEKPLYSSLAEKGALNRLTAQWPEIREKIRVNEQYYYSLVFPKCVKSDCGSICSIEIEMSKNRLADVLIDNRFWDHDLEALGIEFPHILAILDELEISFSDIRWTKKAKYIRDGNHFNQGILFVGTFRGIAISISSFLGDFRFRKGKLIDNKEICRCIRITYKDNHTKVIHFDPANGFPRYHSICQYKSNIEVYKDDMLFLATKDHLGLNEDRGNTSNKCDLENSINLSDNLINAVAGCTLIMLP